MFELIAGFPLYTYYIGLLSQFVLFPILAGFGHVPTFNIYFITYLAKDVAYDMDAALIAHHVISIWGAYFFCDSPYLCFLIAVGEVGSGAYNTYTLAKHYDTYVGAAYVFYVVVMTLSNVYFVRGVVRHKINFYYKIPVLAVVVGRQLFVPLPCR